MQDGYLDLVVVVPGLIGSVLTKDGKPLWGTSPGALWGVIAGNALASMTLSAPDNGDDDLGDGIVPTGLIPNPEIIPGLWKQGGYTRLSASMVETLKLRPGENFHEFPYDWRRDNRVSARKLAAFCTDALSRWREASGNANAKVTIVAHSMGGLVARHYIECLEGWRDVRMLLAVGTPFRGSGNALDFLANGFKWKMGSVSLFDGTEALRTFDSVYQLLPIYPFIASGTGFLRPFETNLPGIDGKRVLAAAEFHNGMTSAFAARHADRNHPGFDPVLRPVVGIGQRTIEAAEIVDGAIKPAFVGIGGNLGGDGTVPRVSAVPVGMDGNTSIYAATTHSALQSWIGVLDNLVGATTGSSIDFDRFRDNTVIEGCLSIDTEDVHSSRRPVVIRADASIYVPNVEARVERLDGPSDLMAPVLIRDGDGYATEIRLPAGAYKVTLSGRGLRPVSDIFLVLDEVP